MSSSKIWSKFSKIVNGKELEFQILELQSDKYDEVVDVIFKYSVPEEPMAIATGVLKNIDAFNEYKDIMVPMLKDANNQKDGIYLDGNMVGVSVMFLTKKGEEFDFERMKLNTKEMQNLFEMWGKFFKYDILGNHGVDSVYEDRGLVILPEYKNLGIEEEILKARLSICKERKVPVASGWFSSPEQIAAAERSGWKAVTEVKYQDIGKETGVVLQGVGKLMVALL